MTTTLDLVRQLAAATNSGPETAKQSLSRLFEHARRIIPDLTLAEFTAARTITSAPDRGTSTAQTATKRPREPGDLARPAASALVHAEAGG